MKKTNQYVFEDYRDDAPEGMELEFDNREDAIECYNRLIAQGYKILNFGSERVIYPVERQGEIKVTYGVYTNHNLPSLS